jgi:hypothetical protein
MVTDLIEYPDGNVLPDQFVMDNREERVGYQSALNHRFSAKSLIRSGIGADVYFLDIRNVDEEVEISNYSGNTVLLKAFTQWQYRVGNSLTLIPGIYGQYYAFNKDYTLEPRMGVKYELSPTASISLGSGLHSQLQPHLVQLFQDSTGNRLNKDLKMSRSLHTVAGYNQKIGTGMRLKTEVYYQHLFNIPITPDIPQQSILNFGDDFYNNWDYTFVNKGTGRNYGLDLTFEKFFDKKYYFLFTGSLYDSKYRGYDGIERHTRFSGNYALKGMFGYEWKLGTRSLLSVNTRATYMGGKRDIPVNRHVTDDGIEVEFDYEKAYEERLPAYFRLDLNLDMKINYRRVSIEWFVGVVNLTNRRNVWTKYFDVARDKDVFIYQYGLMPGGGCRVYF